MNAAKAIRVNPEIAFAVVILVLKNLRIFVILLMRKRKFRESCQSVFFILPKYSVHTINRTTCILAFLLLISGNLLLAQSVFQKTYGGQFYATGEDIRPTSDSGFVVAGTVFGIGAGDFDQYLMRLDKNGNTVWARTFGGTNLDNGISAVQGADGGFLLMGNSFSFTNGQDDFLVTKTDGAGNLQWTRRIGGGNFEKSARVVAMPDSGFAILGITYTYSIGVNYPEPYLLRLDKNGAVVWNRVFYGVDPDYARSLAVTSDGGFILCGQTRTWGVGLYDAFLMKLTSTGTFQWGRVYGGTNVDRAWDVVQTSDGGYAFTGMTESFGVGIQDIMLVKTNSTGVIQWGRTFGGAGWDDGRGLIEDAQGNLVITGFSRSFSSNGLDDMIGIKVSSSGALHWSWVYGGDDYDSASRLCYSLDGNYAMIGYSQSFQAQDRDIYLVKTDTAGVASCNTDSARVLATSPTFSSSAFMPQTNSGLSVSTPPTISSLEPPVQLDSLCNTCDFPTAEFEYFLNSLTISFINTSNLDSIWFWDFGDGSTDSIAEPAHEYAAPGTYTITLVVGNACGTDTLTEQITLANTGDCRLVLRPGPLRGKDAMVHSRDDLQNTNFSISTHMTPMTWTWSGIVGTQRGLLEFDLGFIPANASVVGASLDLYFDDHPTSTHSGSNNWQVRTVNPGAANAWNENIVTWSNQPLAGAPQTNMPVTAGPTVDFPGINVTAQVQNMITNGNNGFQLRLATESTYRRVRIATSDHPNPNIRPRLTIIFGPVNGGAIPDTTSICPGDTVQMSALGGDFYQWRPPLFLSCDSCAATAAWPDSTREYFVVIRDSIGCADLDSVHIIVKDTCCTDTMFHTVATTNPTCGTANNGSITINPSSGTPPFVYTINSGPPQASNVFNGLGPGTYSIHFADSNGCDTTFNVTLTAPPPLLLNVVSTQNPLCNGGFTGSISVSASGGTPGYTYSINLGPGQANGNFNNLPAGNYLLTVSDAGGCQTTLNLNLTNPPALTISQQSLSNVSCNGANDGSVTVSSAGGTPAYSWSLDAGPFGPSPTFNNLSPGPHTVTVMDANGCTATLNFNVSQPTPVGVVLVAVGNVSCNGGSNGALLFAGFGGTLPYTYSLDGINFAPPATISGLSAGNYTITVRDANNCTSTVTAVITEPTPISITLDSLAGTACNNGYVEFSASGGTPPYQYSAGNTPFQPFNAFTGLPSGSQWVYVQDGAGCIDSMAIFIPNLPALTVLPQVSQISCNGANDGSVTLNAGGGTPGYLYSNNGLAYQTGNTYGGLSGGSHWFYVTDAQGCIDSVNVILVEPDPLVLTVNLNDISCNGANDGNAVLVASGGTFPYQYSLDGINFSTNNVFAPVPAGNYTGYLTDARGCQTTVNFTIVEPAPLSFNLDFTVDASCFGGSNGLAQLNGSGGVPPLQYSFPGQGVQNNGLFTGLPAGTFTATLTDANGCTATLPVTIASPTQLIGTLVGTSAEICLGASDGEAEITAAGGTGPYTFALDNGASAISGTYTGLSSGSHTVVITDANGCTTAVNFNIAPGNGPTAKFNVDFDPCRQPVEAVFTNLSQNASLYDWLFGDGNASSDQDPVHLYSDGGTYSIVLVATDANGCQDSAVQSISISGFPIAAFTSNPPLPAVIDQGSPVNFINQSQNASGYYWLFGDGGESRGPNPVHEYNEIGDYCVTLVAYSPSGCTDTTESCLVQVINGNVFIPTGFTPNGDLLNDEFEIVTTALFDDWNLQVFDRWGKLIWETQDVNQYWDASFNQKPVPEGAYVYRLRARTVTGTVIDKSGSVTVVR